MYKNIYHDIGLFEDKWNRLIEIVLRINVAVISEDELSVLCLP